MDGGGRSGAGILVKNVLTAKKTAEEQLIGFNHYWYGKATKIMFAKQFVDQALGNSSYLIASQETGQTAVGERISTIGQEKFWNPLAQPLDEESFVCGHSDRSIVEISVLERRGYRNLALLGGGYSNWLATSFGVVGKK